jgi:hypothetical protein
MQACKPGSVSPTSRGAYHLSCPLVAQRIEQPTQPRWIAEAICGRAALDRGLFGLSTRKVFRASNVTIRAVGSYPAFSPFPLPDKSG